MLCRVGTCRGGLTRGTVLSSGGGRAGGSAGGSGGGNSGGNSGGGSGMMVAMATGWDGVRCHGDSSIETDLDGVRCNGDGLRWGH